MERYKLLMDPVYDEFIMIERGSVLDKVLDTPLLQRLRYIRQLGPCYYVYPGAEHTRFQHSLGVMWLSEKAVGYLRKKGFAVDANTERLITLSALVHDLGHSPFSHALENTIIPLPHEKLTLKAVDMLESEKLIDKELANGVKSVISKTYSKSFVYQLISSQLDCDRLDYLRRDAFYTGVSFGKVDVNRILVSILIDNNEVVWSYRGLNALEAYVMSRYEMYWAVYFHKVNLAAQVLLRKIVKRIRYLINEGKNVDIDKTLFKTIKEGKIEDFFRLTDANVITSIYMGVNSDDGILSDLSKRFIKRDFFRTVELKHPSDVLIFKERLERKGFDTDYYMEVVEPSKVAYSYYSPSGVDLIKVKLNGRLDELSNIAPTDAIRSLSRKISKAYVVVPNHG